MDIGNEIDRAAENMAQPRPWIERLARMGYFVKGVVYFLIGLLAIQAAFGLGGETTGTEGALKALQRQPFGQILLVLTAVGLIGYTLWRLTQAWFDPDHTKSRTPQRIVQRIGYAISASGYGLLAWEAIRMVMGFARSSSSQGGTEHWIARVMAQPFGVWLVGLVGLIVIGVGLFQVYFGVTAKFRKELKLHEMSASERAWAMRSGRVGYSARGFVYTIVGGIVVWAAIHYEPGAAADAGIEEVFDKVAQQQPFGAGLLALVAIGFMAYAAFAFVQARYRNIEVDDLSGPAESS